MNFFFNKDKFLFIIILASIILFNFNTNFDDSIFTDGQHTSNKRIFKYDNECSKWIVFTAFNPPSHFIKGLEKIIDKWKIVVIGNNETNDIKWDIFKNSKTLFYLNFEDQKNLNFKVHKYLKLNSIYRNTLGYLYAIQRGAKEIYEIDENLIFYDLSFLNDNFENKIVSYGTRNDSLQ